MPKQQIVELSTQQKIDVLDFYRFGRLTKDTSAIESIEDLDRSAIVRAFLTAGLLRKLRGRGNGQVNIRSTLGTIALEALRDSLEDDDDDPLDSDKPDLDHDSYNTSTGDQPQLRG